MAESEASETNAPCGSRSATSANVNVSGAKGDPTRMAISLTAVLVSPSGLKRTNRTGAS